MQPSFIDQIVEPDHLDGLAILASGIAFISYPRWRRNQEQCHESQRDGRENPGSNGRPIGRSCPHDRGCTGGGRKQHKTNIYPSSKFRLHFVVLYDVRVKILLLILHCIADVHV
jgi:hypothetical protein